MQHTAVIKDNHLARLQSENNAVFRIPVIRQTVQKLIAGGHLLVGQVGMQGQGDRCIGQSVRVRFVDHLEGGAKVGFPQKTNALGHFNTGA